MITKAVKLVFLGSFFVALSAHAGSIAWVSVSMNAFTSNASQIGVPDNSADIFNEIAVSSMNVYSDVVGVATGTNLSTGYLQFWPGCYHQSGSPTGSYATGYDVLDTTSPCYGSMQIGNGLGNTVFAYDSFGGGLDGNDFGIGNDPGTSATDWTFSGTVGSLNVKEIEVFVNDQSLPNDGSSGITLSGPGLQESGYTLVYALEPGSSTYQVDNSSLIDSNSFTRVAYYVEYDTTSQQLSTTPEPATLGLVGSALIGLLARRKKR